MTSAIPRLWGLLPALALTAALWGRPAAAQTWPSDPAPPAAGATPEVVRAWITRNIDETGYVETASNSVVVLLYDPASVRTLADGHVEGVFRSELFSPLDKDGHTIRSARKVFEIDCGAAIYREVSVEVFAGSNLHRPIPGVPPAPGWTKPLAADTSGGKAIRLACERARTMRP